MKLTKIIGLAALSLCMASTANAAFKVEVTDGTTTKTIIDEDDGTLGDAADALTGTPGAISYTCISCFGGWDIAFNLAESKPVLGSATNPYMHMTTSLTNIAGTSGAGGIWIKITDTDFVGPTTGTMVSSAGGVLAASSMKLDSYIDSSNAEFGTGTALTSQTSFGPAGSNYSTSDPFSMTMIAYVDGTGTTGVTSIDWTVKVPAPATLALLGIGLLGMGAVNLRRNKA